MITSQARITLADLQGRATITVEEYGQLMGLSRESAYNAANNGDAPTLRVGRRILIPVPALLRQLGADA